jgi:hypothetical protein
MIGDAIGITAMDASRSGRRGLRRSAVAPAAGEQENYERGGLRGYHQAKVARGSRQVEHRPGERERRDRIAEQRHQLAGEEQAKLAFLERAERDPPHLGLLPGSAPHAGPPSAP